MRKYQTCRLTTSSIPEGGNDGIERLLFWTQMFYSLHETIEKTCNENDYHNLSSTEANHTKPSQTSSRAVMTSTIKLYIIFVPAISFLTCYQTTIHNNSLFTVEP